MSVIFSQGEISNWKISDLLWRNNLICRPYTVYSPVSFLWGTESPAPLTGGNGRSKNKEIKKYRQSFRLIDTFVNCISVHPYGKMPKYVLYLEYFFLSSPRQSGAEQGAWVICLNKTSALKQEPPCWQTAKSRSVISSIKPTSAALRTVANPYALWLEHRI